MASLPGYRLAQLVQGNRVRCIAHTLLATERDVPGPYDAVRPHLALGYRLLAPERPLLKRRPIRSGRTSRRVQQSESTHRLLYAQREKVTWTTKLYDRANDELDLDGIRRTLN